MASSGETLVNLGDGSTVFMNVYEVEWSGAWRQIKAYEGEDDALIGVSLLKGLEVRIPLIVSGEVRVTHV